MTQLMELKCDGVVWQSGNVFGDLRSRDETGHHLKIETGPLLLWKRLAGRVCDHRGMSCLRCDPDQELVCFAWRRIDEEECIGDGDVVVISRLGIEEWQLLEAMSRSADRNRRL